MPPDTVRLELEELLSVLDGEATLMLDLKCFTRYAARRIQAEVPSRQSLIVSSRSWWTLAPFRRRSHTLLLRSCANRTQLWIGTRLPGLGENLGIVAHERLLNATTAADIRRQTPFLFSWGAADRRRCRSLVGVGVTGLIVDDLDIVE